MLKAIFGPCDIRAIHFDICARAALAWTKKNVHLEMGKLKQTELQRLKTEERKLRIRFEKKNTENHKKCTWPSQKVEAG